MPFFLLGTQKYLTVGLVVLCLILGTAAWGFRATANHEADKRAQVEEQLRQTVEAITELRSTHASQLLALERAQSAQDAYIESRRSARERILNTPNDQDPPVADVLRDAVSGMR